MAKELSSLEFVTGLALAWLAFLAIYLPGKAFSAWLIRRKKGGS